jgi:hypothetical protein
MNSSAVPNALARKEWVKRQLHKLLRNKPSNRLSHLFHRVDRKYFIIAVQMACGRMTAGDYIQHVIPNVRKKSLSSSEKSFADQCAKEIVTVLGTVRSARRMRRMFEYLEFEQYLEYRRIFRRQLVTLAVLLSESITGRAIEFPKEIAR